jgi:hypothetical protein
MGRVLELQLAEHSDLIRESGGVERRFSRRSSGITIDDLG